MRKKIRLIFILSAVTGLVVLILSLITFFFLNRYYMSHPARNLLVLSSESDQVEPLVLIQVFPQDGKVRSVIINPKLKVEVIGGYQEYELRSVYPLLKMDKQSDQFIVASISQSLGVILDDLVVVKEVPTMDDDHHFKRGVGSLILSRTGKLRQKLFLMGLNLKVRLNEVLLSFVNIESLPNRDIYSLELSSAQNDYGGCSVSVLNTTSLNGLGRRYADFLENNGFRVVRVTDGRSQQDRSKIVWDGVQSSCQMIVDRALNSLPGEKIEVNQEVATQNRAEIVIMLGEDFE